MPAEASASFVEATRRSLTPLAQCSPNGVHPMPTIATAYLRLSGFFQLVMTLALRRARTPLALLATVVVASGVLSAFFVNDVVCLVLAPVVLEATRQLALPPVPYLVALVTAANVGSVATLTGNPQNMLVGSFSFISYRSFLARVVPIAVG